jgi:hypothetical protein
MDAREVRRRLYLHRNARTAQPEPARPPLLGQEQTLDLPSHGGR